MNSAFTSVRRSGTRYLKCLTLLVAIGLAACSSPTDSEDYDVKVVLPPDFASAPSGTKHPLIVFLHGAGGPFNYDEMFTQMSRSYPDFPFVVILPETDRTDRWFSAPITRAIDDAVKEYNIDESRIYITGLSMGGAGAYDMAIRHPTRFAALVMIAGYANTALACQLRDMPVWLIHNREDPVIPPGESADIAAAVEACGGTVRFDLTNAQPNLHPHNAWTPIYTSNAFYDWLLQHRRN